MAGLFPPCSNPSISPRPRGDGVIHPKPASATPRMLSDPKNVLTVPTLPARLTAAETAVLLGFAPHDIPTLVAARLLAPLGKVHRNAVKYFATVELLRLRDDSAWLGRATRTVNEHWLNHNSRRRNPNARGRDENHPASMGGAPEEEGDRGGRG